MKKRKYQQQYKINCNLIVFVSLQVFELGAPWSPLTIHDVGQNIPEGSSSPEPAIALPVSLHCSFMPNPQN